MAIMNKNTYEQLALKFSYLSNLKPAGIKNKITLFDDILSENFVHEFNPERYAFYMKIMKAFQNPDILKNVIYENKLIKGKQEEIDAIYEKIMNKLMALYRVDEKEIKNSNGIPINANDTNHNTIYAQKKKEAIQNANTKIASRINSVIKSEYDSDEQSKKVTDIVNSIFGPTNPNQGSTGGYKQMGVDGEKKEGDEKKKTTEEPKQEANSSDTNNPKQIKQKETEEPKQEANSSDTNNPDDPNYQNIEELKERLKKQIKQKKQDFYDGSKLMTYTNKIKHVIDADFLKEDIKAQRLKDILIEFDDDEMYSMKKFKLTKEDKLMFIFVTFMIRLIVLMIIDWSLTSNFIVNFYQAYTLYIGLYCIFLLIIIVVVNMSYSMGSKDGMNGFAATLASSMYFFYLVPGKMKSSSIRILVHFSVIIFMTLISMFIVYNPNNTEGTINYNYSEKKYIKRQLNNFTLILWLFTSFLALTFKVS
jgi:hypothetical protein